MNGIVTSERLMFSIDKPVILSKRQINSKVESNSFVYSWIFVFVQIRVCQCWINWHLLQCCCVLSRQDQVFMGKTRAVWTGLFYPMTQSYKEFSSTTKHAWKSLSMFGSCFCIWIQCVIGISSFCTLFSCSMCLCFCKSWFLISMCIRRARPLGHIQGDSRPPEPLPESCLLQLHGCVPAEKINTRK